MSVFNYLEYREWVDQASKQIKKRRPAQTRHRIAEAIGVQPTYFSNVCRQRAHFSSDQLHSFSEIAGLAEVEQEYVFLLFEHNRSGLEKRRKYLHSKLEKLRKENLKTEKHLSAKKVKVETDHTAEYYLHPELKLIHMFVGLERFQENWENIAKSLNLSEERVQSALTKLMEMGLVYRKGGGFGRSSTTVHLPSDSIMTRPHQEMLKSFGTRHSFLLPEEEKYHFSLTFTASESAKAEVRKEFLNFLKRAESIVGSSEPENVYQIFFDLFAWSR